MKKASGATVDPDVVKSLLMRTPRLQRRFVPFGIIAKALGADEDEVRRTQSYPSLLSSDF